MAEQHPADPFNARRRQELFLRLATRPEGVTAQDAHDEATRLGDDVTVEAYFNLGRRLAHRGLVVSEKTDRVTLYKAGANVDTQWLDEEQLASIVDPEYPLLALAVIREARRQIAEVPETVWVEARHRLMNQSARHLFFDAITAYADDLANAVRQYEHEKNSTKDGSVRRNEIETALVMLKELTKFGLGLSREAIDIPPSFAIALQRIRDGVSLYNEEKLQAEIAQRVSDENLIVEVSTVEDRGDALVAAIDGSTRGGLLSLEGEDGDFSIGHAPSISINTSTAQVNRRLRTREGKEYPAFLRLPEKPEDMQLRNNRYTIMARLFHPDLSETQYAHSVWNAMNLLENRAALEVMGPWTTARDGAEVRPADIVLMDGPVTPQDRESSHYANQSTYGRIVRELIDVSWSIAQKSRDNGQVVAGVVKNAQLRVFGPVINSFLVNVVARERNTQITAWPLNAMNAVSDQALLSRLLTAGRKKSDPWTRTCLVLRPFHSVTDIADRFSRDRGPSHEMLNRAEKARERRALGIEEADDSFWCDSFRGKGDPYVLLLENAWYANFFLGSVPRLDQKQALPRFEILVPVSTDPKAHPTRDAGSRLSALLSALRRDVFEVHQDHSLFARKGWIDVLPRLLIEVHTTVKIWAAELQSRVNEYVGYHLSRYLKTNRGSIRIRPWRKDEIELWLAQMTDERRQIGGG